MKNNKRKLFAYSIYACSIILSLSACGGGNQDKGKASPFVQNFSGVAVDGHIARAKVFIDSNNNGTRDPWEEFSFTDNDGYYGYNPKTGTDYCASTATEQQKQYCLSVNSQYDEIVVRIDGGYDKLTGEPFIGQLSRRINAKNPVDTNSLVITPITTLLTNVPSQQQDNVLANLGIEQRDLDIDYLNSRGNNEVDGYLLNTALKIHKTVTILSDRINDNYPQMLETTGMANDASSAVYTSLGSALASNTSGLDNLLSRSSSLIQVLDTAEASIRNNFDRYDLELPTDMGSLENPQQFNRPVNIANQIPTLVDTLFDDAMDPKQVMGNARALETIVIKSVNESSQADTSIENAFTFFLDEQNTSLIDALRISLSDEKADINILVNSTFTGDVFTSETSLSNAIRLPDSANAFSDLGVKQLHISDLDLGSSPNDLSDIELEVYFNEGTSELDGTLTVCAKYINGASQTSLGEGNFKGEVFNGFWSLLGANSSEPSSYSLLLTFEFLGATYQAIMKPAGNITINGTDYQQIRFDYDGEIRVWHSKEGLTELQSIPLTNIECANRLPSRIGL